jgi:hypothetical protein
MSDKKFNKDENSKYFPSQNDVIPLNEFQSNQTIDDAWMDFQWPTLGRTDNVNSPPHYTRGKQEAIEIIEEAIQDAPDVKTGMLQAQALKYLLRVWLKDNSKQDLEKARWYLNRLIASI